MRNYFSLFLLLNILIVNGQNIDDNIYIIDWKENTGPVIFYDNIISDTLRGGITVTVRFNTHFGDTIAELNAEEIELQIFRLTNSKNINFSTRGNKSGLSELGIEELRLFHTYSEKMINIYWQQPYNKIKVALKYEHGDISTLNFMCPFVIIPCNTNNTEANRKNTKSLSK